MSEWASETEVMSRFSTWLQNSGAQFDAINVQRQYGHFQLIATKAIKKGERVATVPLSICLFNNDWEEERIDELLDLKESERLQPYITSIIRLMLEMRNPCSIWRPYLNMLPDFIPGNIARMDEEQKQLVSRSACWPTLNHSVTEYKEEWRILQGLTNEIGGFSEQAFFWARNLCFNRGIRGKYVGWEDRYLFLPLFDMSNYSTEANLSFMFNKKKQLFDAWAKQDIEPGDEITLQPLELDNTELLINYGWTLPNNSSKKAMLPFGRFLVVKTSSKDVPVGAHGRSLLVTTSDVHSLHAMMARLRCWCINGVGALDLQLKPYLSPLSVENERTMLLSLCELCELRISELPREIIEQQEEAHIHSIKSLTKSGPTSIQEGGGEDVSDARSDVDSSADSGRQGEQRRLLHLFARGFKGTLDQNSHQLHQAMHQYHIWNIYQDEQKVVRSLKQLAMLGLEVIAEACVTADLKDKMEGLPFGDDYCERLEHLFLRSEQQAEPHKFSASAISFNDL